MQSVFGMVVSKWHVPPSPGTSTSGGGEGGRPAYYGLDGKQHNTSILLKRWCAIDYKIDRYQLSTILSSPKRFFFQQEI